MDEISKDAKKRYKEKLIRTERMETFKKQATLAFKRKEFERALVLYTKVSINVKFVNISDQTDNFICKISIIMFTTLLIVSCLHGKNID